MVVFSLIAAFVGTPELSMIYVPIILPLLLSLGFDAMTSVAIPITMIIIQRRFLKFQMNLLTIKYIYLEWH